MFSRFDVPSARFSSSPGLVAAGFLALVLSLASEARAFERQWHLGGKAGFASLERRGTGPAAGVHAAYGISDMFDLELEGLASRHGGSEGTDMLSASAGVAYKIDVFEWIPYLAVLGGYYHWAGRPGPGGETGGELGGSVQLGLDYLVMRELAFGVDLRWHASLADGITMPLWSATLGAEYRFGY